MTTRKRAIIREIKRLHARREPLNISAVTRNHPELIRRVYAVRPFWGWKRALKDAGLDYSKINTELRDYVDCQICGKDLGALAYHLVSQHEITPEEYREEYPEAEIVCERIRAGIAHRKQRHRPALPHWEDIWSAEYVLDRMAELHRRGLPMNWKWVKRHESGLSDKAIRFFDSWDNALRRIDLDPARIRLFRPTWRGISPWRRANKAAIVAALRRRSKAGGPLSWKEILPQEHGPAFLERAKKVFGSWSAALAAAGLDPTGRAVSKWGGADKTDILTEIEHRRRARRSVRYSGIWKERGGQPLARRASALFGSWNAALRAAGIEPKRGRSQWAGASKAAIVSELRRRKRAGQSVRLMHVTKERRGRALQNRVTVLFGTWNAALRAAGIEPVKENSAWKRAALDGILSEIRRRNRAGESLATTKVERTKFGNPLINRAKVLFGSWGAALVAAGIKVPLGIMSPWARADKPTILAEIRRRDRTDEPLRYSKMPEQQWGLPLRARAEKLFGSWTAALHAADVKLRAIVAATTSPWPNADRAAILAEIQRRDQLSEPLGYKHTSQTKWGKPLLRRATVLFGSWSNALREAGIAPHNANSPWPKATKASVIVEIRRRKAKGQTFSSTQIARECWGEPLLRRAKALFGSWQNALLAAGLDRAQLPERKRWSRADEAAVLAEIRRRKRVRGPLRSGDVARENGAAPLVRRAVNLFGSWNAAVSAAFETTGRSGNNGKSVS
jgi:hypothetical protein